MNTISSKIEVVSQDQHVTQCLSILTEAFHADPAARWLFPHEQSYRESFTRFAKAFAGPAFTEGTAYLLSENTGAAAWFAPEVHGDDDEVISLLEETVPSDRIKDAFALFEQMDAFHPTHPHWYLPLIGVAPRHQGGGHGSHLLRHVLTECDRTQMDAYLEASSTNSIPLYQRHGFELMGEIQTGTSPSLYPMIRKPQPTTR